MDLPRETLNLVAEIEEAVAAAEQRARARMASRIAEPIDNRLGVVEVSGTGELLSVELDREYLRYSTESALATAVKAAILNAEARAKGER
ncbi:hypothetical protein [Allokutzneria albata]|uniref:YbaB/EbfC DNA-binding family protein n=1 Tax=Allokutzneria albata TaxID=211114 RepID=A0A1H0DKU2_ALLAB|nr:hypothetical protein [Allokutzneria albata]SDN70679.1 hypothetical protein SAMN04489726_7862 [Allokutzneria albata]